MKTKSALLLAGLMVTCLAWSQQAQTSTPTAFVPYHEIIKQHYQNQETLNNWMQPHNNASRGSLITVYRKVGYSMDVWNAASSNWQTNDSCGMQFAANNMVEDVTGYAFNGTDWNNRYHLGYEYDGNRNELSHVSQTWMPDANTWQNQTGVFNTYDSYNNRLTSQTQTWNASTGAWNGIGNVICTYDGRNLTSQTMLTWNFQNSAWTNVQQYQYVYNADNTLNNSITLTWNGTAWQNTQQLVYGYDGQGHKIGLTTRQWQNNDWVNASMITYTVDDNGRTTESVVTNWVNNYWQNTYHTIYTYNNLGLTTSETGMVWNLGLNAWDSTYRYSYTYNTDGQQLSYMSEMYYDGAFHPNAKNVYTYNAQGRLTAYEEQTGNGANWQGVDRYTYGYMVGKNPNPVYELHENFNASTGSYQNAEQYNFYYEPYLQSTPTAVNEVAAIDAKVFPNPSTPGSNLNLQLNMGYNSALDLNVYDVSGRLMNRQTLAVNTGVNTVNLTSQSWEPGYYMVQLVDRNNGAKNDIKFLIQ